MSKQARQVNRQTRAAQQKAKGQTPTVVLGVVVALVVMFAVIFLATKSKPKATNTTADGLVPANIVTAVTSVPDSVFTAVGEGKAVGFPKVISGSALTENGKPRIVYMGGEFCPYCAAERWAMVVALSRFGTFSNLETSHSSTSDSYPNTPTFTFHGATYTSQYISFDPVELLTNIPNGKGGYTTLDKPSALQSSLEQKYDPSGGIPFIDFANKSTILGPTLDPAEINGRTYQEIADGLTDPTNSTTKAIIGAANGITAAVCQTTNNQPGNVCQSPTISSIQKKIS